MCSRWVVTRSIRPASAWAAQSRSVSASKSTSCASDAALFHQADEKSFLCFKTLTQRARDLQRRYADAGRLSGTHSGACFWFLQTPSHSEGALSAERLRLLSEGAQNALLEHVEYIANLNPMPAINELVRTLSSSLRICIDVM